jgi:hypothetical protein
MLHSENVDDLTNCVCVGAPSLGVLEGTVGQELPHGPMLAFGEDAPK